MRIILITISCILLFNCEQKKPNCGSIDCIGIDINKDYDFPILNNLIRADSVSFDYGDSTNTVINFTIRAVKRIATKSLNFSDSKCENQRTICANTLTVDLKIIKNGIITPFGTIYYEKCDNCIKNYYMIWDDSTQYLIDSHRNYNLPDSSLFLSSPNCTNNSCRLSYFSKSNASSWVLLKDSVLIKNYDKIYYVELNKPFARSAQRKLGVTYDTNSAYYMYMNRKNGILLFGNSKSKEKYYLKY
ncbi:MAG: hypothetical protein SFY32_14560 [Bacteroidota bacterium]|nr:hypothetical protein [Bacteroidota bacterium]